VWISQPNAGFRVNKAVRATATAALDLLAPERCIYCDQLSRTRSAVCGYCARALPLNNDACPQCALPGCGAALCPDCLQRPPALTSIRAAFTYDPALALFMHQWKYLADRRLSLTAAKLLLSSLILSSKNGILMPTPLHWRRLLKRGFNQSDDLLHALCSNRPDLRAACTKSLRLVRREATAQQVGASRAERAKNLRGVFAARGDFRDRVVTLIDDVCTTGATGNAMASTLLDAGAREVHLICLARTPAH